MRLRAALRPGVHAAVAGRALRAARPGLRWRLGAWDVWGRRGGLPPPLLLPLLALGLLLVLLVWCCWKRTRRVPRGSGEADVAAASTPPDSRPRPDWGGTGMGCERYVVKCMRISLGIQWEARERYSRGRGRQLCHATKTTWR